jgi:hypothetical protein
MHAEEFSMGKKFNEIKDLFDKEHERSECDKAYDL